jgi:hypothetical protein
MRAFSSVATSSALKGTRLALRIVSIREVAVTIWEEPEDREVYSHSVGSDEYDFGVLDADIVDGAVFIVSRGVVRCSERVFGLCTEQIQSHTKLDGMAFNVVSRV